MGSTHSNRHPSLSRRDHPHIHGEHLITLAHHDLTDGITPIYMGSTVLAYVMHVIDKDHPHIHGEHYQLPRLGIGDEGSPPYTWGALLR